MKKFLFFIFCGCLVCSCKKFVEIAPPSTQIITSAVYSNDQTALSAIAGTYSSMMQNILGFANSGITLYCGLSADELTNYSTDYNQSEFYTNSLIKSNTFVNSLWSQAYNYIYNANAVLAGEAASAGVSGPVKTEIEGEAKFIRAFCYFYLVNLYGDVPLVTTTAYSTNAVLPRVAKDSIYQQIIADLKAAQNLLVTDYSYGGGQRIRPNAWAATALLARVYLYSKDWANSEAAATAVLNDSSDYTLATDPNAVFLANSTEAILQWQPVVPGYNTWDGAVFILTSTPNIAALSNNVYNAFENGDLRKAAWIDSFYDGTQNYYFPYKYKVQYAANQSEYEMVLRLGEQYLIRAEARAEQNNIPGALADLNTIRARAGLAPATSGSQATMLAAVYHERQVELFCEWGHRWFDLIRTGNASQIMPIIASQKGGTWNASDSLYPIPLYEMQNDPNLTQNAGY